MQHGNADPRLGCIGNSRSGRDVSIIVMSAPPNPSPSSNPAPIASGASGNEPELLFYDGDCGVCHWAVKFVAARDPDGSSFRFAPLHGITFEESLPADMAANLPDSLVVLDRDGRVLFRSSGLVHILRRLGGVWGPVGSLLWIVPRPLRDLGYDLFARIRHRLVARPEATCPVLPPELRGRFGP